MDSFFQRWKVTIYFALSTVLAFTAFSIAIHSTVILIHTPPPILRNPRPPPLPIFRRLSTDATLHLRRSGFSLATSLLLTSHNTFFSSPNSTVFALNDSFFSTASAASPPAAAQQLLLNQLLPYHTSPLLLQMLDILKFPPGTCLPTLVQGKSLLVTKIDEKYLTAEINGVNISHPDIVLERSIAIHGVDKPFLSSDLVPTCD
ncbi:Fasciclin-like arabinogalactan protein 21 [Linum perenne]